MPGPAREFEQADAGPARREIAIRVLGVEGPDGGLFSAGRSPSSAPLLRDVDLQLDQVQAGHPSVIGCST